MSEETIYTIRRPAPINTIEFRLTNKEFGRLRATDDGRLEFEGDVESSAKVFFDYICTHFEALRDSDAQSQLAALREELAQRDSFEELYNAAIDERDAIQHRLADAERRNAELEKDAARYQWLRDKSESVHQFYLSTPIWFTGVKFNKESVDSAIDAALNPKPEAASHDE